MANTFAAILSNQIFNFHWSATIHIAFAQNAITKTNEMCLQKELFACILYGRAVCARCSPTKTHLYYSNEILVSTNIRSKYRFR